MGEYAMKTLKFTEKACKWLSRQLKLSEPTSYYKVIDGQKYDASLLSEVENIANNGEISEAEAKRLWEEADDGKGVSEMEKVTLKYALGKTKFSDRAKVFLNGRLDSN